MLNRMKNVANDLDLQMTFTKTTTGRLIKLLMVTLVIIASLVGVDTLFNALRSGL